MFKHILVPTDGSQLSQNAVRNAVAFAKENGARITALYAKPEFHPYFVEGLSIDEKIWQKTADLAEKDAREILGFVEKTCQDAGVSCKTETPQSLIPHEAIIEAATRNACDLIFMASHGRRGLSALLLGSETTKVLTHSKIPVLVYR